MEIGAVQAAWDQVCIVRAGRDQRQWPVLSRRIADATALYGASELLRGTLFLMDGALHRIGAGQPGRAAFAEKFTNTLIGKLRRWDGLVESADLPMVAQAVRVSFDDGDPVAWREGAGPVPESEPRALTVALALIANFVDTVDGPGTCEHALLTALGDALN